MASQISGQQSKLIELIGQIFLNVNAGAILKPELNLSGN
jgi:hypothetical protein